MDLPKRIDIASKYLCLYCILIDIEEMPKILIYRALIFFFYAGDIKERGHVHIVNNKGYLQAAKIWFEGEIELFEQGSLTAKEISTAIKLIEKNQPYLLKVWRKFVSGQKVRVKIIAKI
ncbi:MAG: DUF4160 domain-containing protein [Cytophagales bacterium]